MTIYCLLNNSYILGSSLDCMCLQFSHLYNVEEGTCLLPYADNLVYSQDEVICLYNNKEDQLQVWEMFKRVQMLDLTVDERALAGAIVLMNASRSTHMYIVIHLLVEIYDFSKSTIF